MKVTANRIFSIIFTVLMTFTVINAMFEIFSKYSYSIIAILTIAAGFLIIAVYKYFRLIAAKYKTADVYLFITSSVVMLIIQLILIKKLNYIPNHDSLYIDIAARNFAEDGNYTHIQRGIENHKYYLSRFPNNWAYLMILSGIYRIDFLLFGKVHYKLAPLISGMAIQLSLMIAYLTARLVIKDRGQRCLIAVSPLFMPVYYLYTPICYTDTVSMPFAVLSVYCFIRSIKSKSDKISKVWIICTALVVGIGYTIKGSLCILAVAFSIYTLFEKGLKKAVKNSTVIVVSIMICSKIVTSIGISAGITNRELYESKQFPPSHWVMMSLVGDGTFDYDEFRYTVRYQTYESKDRAAKERIVEHLNNYTPFSFFKHLSKKSSVTWADGSYYAFHHISSSDNKRLINFLSGYFMVLYYDVFQSFFLLSMLISFINGMFRKRISYDFLFRLSAYGLTLFLLIWETRSRYLVNFMPLMTFLYSDGTKRLYYLAHSRIALYRNMIDFDILKHEVS